MTSRWSTISSTLERINGRTQTPVRQPTSKGIPCRKVGPHRLLWTNWFHFKCTTSVTAVRCTMVKHCGVHVCVYIIYSTGCDYKISQADIKGDTSILHVHLYKNNLQQSQIYRMWVNETQKVNSLILFRTICLYWICIDFVDISTVTVQTVITIVSVRLRSRQRRLWNVLLILLRLIFFNMVDLVQTSFFYNIPVNCWEWCDLITLPKLCWNVLRFSWQYLKRVCVKKLLYM